MSFKYFMKSSILYLLLVRCLADNQVSNYRYILISNIGKSPSLQKSNMILVIYEGEHKLSLYYVSIKVYTSLSFKCLTLCDPCTNERDEHVFD